VAVVKFAQIAACAAGGEAVVFALDFEGRVWVNGFATNCKWMMAVPPDDGEDEDA
jgi:hypothetical protein